MVALWYQLKKIGVVMKKARYFITCNELPTLTVNELTPEAIHRMFAQKTKRKEDDRQLSFQFED